LADQDDGKVVTASTELSDDIDALTGDAINFVEKLVALRARVEKLNLPPPMTLSLSEPISKPEGNTGTTLFAFMLTLGRNGSTEEVPYTYVVTGSGENPAAAADFGGTYPSGSGVFGPTETMKIIQILATGDYSNEPNEMFTLSATAAGLTMTSTGTILNDDSPAPVPAFLFSGPSSILEGTPAQIVPAFSFAGPASIVEGTPQQIAPVFVFAGPASIIEGTPEAIVPTFLFAGPATINEGNPPLAQYGFTGPATIIEGN